MASSITYNGPNTPDKYLNFVQDKTFNFEHIENKRVTNIIKNLKNKHSTGYDGISFFLLKRLQPVITEALTFIINLSIKTGIFPDKLKVAKIVPIYKKDDKYNIENYRPISLLPAISKVFEKAVHDQLSNYFITNDFLFDSQYGFHSHHSTEHAVLELIDQVSLAIDKGHTQLSIFLDLSKAFDTLNYGILLQKLKFYGINGVSLSWFKSYLQNRLHYVELQPSIRSSNISLTTGIPQGSILGPLLYIIYMNDIQYSSEYFKYFIYADDTTLVKPLIQFDKNINHIKINTELTNIHEWLSINKL